MKTTIVAAAVFSSLFVGAMSTAHATSYLDDYNDAATKNDSWPTTFGSPYVKQMNTIRDNALRQYHILGSRMVDAMDDLAKNGDTGRVAALDVEIKALHKDLNTMGVPSGDTVDYEMLTDGALAAVSYEVPKSKNPRGVNPEAVAQVTGAVSTSEKSQRPSYEGWVAPVKVAPVVITEPTESVLKVPHTNILMPRPVVDAVVKAETVTNADAQRHEGEAHNERMAAAYHRDVIAHESGSAHSVDENAVAQSKEAAAHSVRMAEALSAHSAPLMLKGQVHSDTSEMATDPTEEVTEETVSVREAPVMLKGQVHDVAPVAVTKTNPETSKPVVASKPTVKAPVTETLPARPKAQPVTKAVPQVAPVVNNYYHTDVNRNAVSRDEFHKESRKLSAGVSSALAVSGLPQIAGKTVTMGLGAGSFDGSSAVALGATVTPQDSNVAIKFGVGYDSEHNAALSGGIGIGF